MIGKRLGHYEITELIGAGGMGEVYRARDTRLSRDVAIKLLPESFAADADRLSRFEREARLLAGLNHPNIASIYGIEELDSQRFLVLELVEGVDLSKRLSEGPLMLEDALAVAHQVAEALEAAHEQGVIHRDLKPANVVVTPGGTVKVLDFGLAKAVESDQSSSALTHSPTVMASSPTVQGVILGTAPYMSPEQARGKVVDRRADIWAFGVTLLETLTARRVFEGETVSDTLASVIKSEPDWGSLPDGTPQAIVTLLRRCLDKNPSTRLRDIGEARIIIDRVLRGELPDHAELVASPSSRSPLVGIVATVLVALAAGAAAWFLKPGPPEPPVRRFSLVVKSEDGHSPFDPVVSPDGSMVAYVLDRDLYVQELDQLEPRKLNVASSGMLFWSPDSRSIGYLNEEKIWRVPASGGNPVKICDPEPVFTSGRGGTWTGNDRIIYAHGSSAIYEVSASGGDPHVYVPLEEDESDFHEPHVLPGDRGIIFVVHRRNAAPERLDVFANGERKMLLRIDGVRLSHPVYSRSGHIVFHRSGSNPGVWAVPFSLSTLELTGEPFPVSSDGASASVSNMGTLVYLRGATGQTRTISWVGRDGKVGEALAEQRPGYFDPALSPDGKKLAICEWDGTEVDIWIHDLQRRTRTRFTFQEGPQYSPVWSPDGTLIYYEDARGDTVKVRRADGTGSPVAVTEGLEPDISADGAYLTFYRVGRSTQEDIWYTSLSDPGDAKQLLATPAREHRPRISPDGNYLAYESDESGKSEIYIKRFPGGEGKWQVSTHGGTRPVWGHSGRSLYYQEDNCDLMEVSVSTEPGLTLGSPQKVLDCTASGLQAGFHREYVLSNDEAMFLWPTSAVNESGNIDVGITVVDNWPLDIGR